jgi:hypothetical protein
MDVTDLSARVDRSAAAWGPTALRWTAALLWLANLNWKIPPDFGRSEDACRMLCRYVEAGAEHPVAPGSGWVFEHLVSPQLSAFGWITLLSEAALVALLVSGRFVRTAAVLGIAQSIGVGLSVANAPDEWFWAYVLMVALHLAILVTASSARRQSGSTMALVTVGYGVLVGIAHAGAGFTGSGDWLLFDQANDVPGELGRGILPGSIALGLAFVVIGLVAFGLADRVPADRLRPLGWITVAVAVGLLLTYRQGGLVIGLGSRPGSAAVLGALGLALARPLESTRRPPAPARDPADATVG